MKKNTYKRSLPYCGDCPYLDYEDADGYGICRITRQIQNCGNTCPICTLKQKLNDKELARLLHHIQKWRRGAKMKMPHPTLYGFAIDECIRLLRRRIWDMEHPKKKEEEKDEVSKQLKQK